MFTLQLRVSEDYLDRRGDSYGGNIPFALGGMSYCLCGAPHTEAVLQTF